MSRRLTVAAVALATCLLIVELALRAIGYAPLDDFDEDRERLQVLRPSENPILGYELRPEAHGFVWDAQISVNALGFRDREYTLEKPEGTTRILALGDSVTFGIGLPADVLWPKRLEELARETRPSTEVLNLGITGYDVLQEVELLERRGLELAPDHVVLAYHVNDLGRVSPAGRLIDRIVERRSPWLRSRLYQFARTQLDRIAVNESERSSLHEGTFRAENAAFLAPIEGDAALGTLVNELRQLLEPRDPGYAHRYLPWYTSEARIGRLRFCFERLARLADEHDFGVTVLLVPWLDDKGYADAYDLAYALAAHEARRVGFEVADPVPAFREIGLRRLRLGGKDRSHPGRTGHRLLAMQAAESLGFEFTDPRDRESSELQDR